MDNQRKATEGIPTHERLRLFLVPTVRPAALAREAGVSRQYVGSVLKGERPASRKIVSACKRLGLPVEEIFYQPVSDETEAITTGTGSTSTITTDGGRDACR